MSNAFLLLGCALAVLIMTVLVVMCGITVGLHSQHKKLVRAEYQAMSTATIATLACIILVENITGSMKQNLGEGFSVLMACFSLGLFFIGGLLGAWQKVRTTPPRS